MNDSNVVTCWTMGLVNNETEKSLDFRESKMGGRYHDFEKIQKMSKQFLVTIMRELRSRIIPKD